MGTSHTRLLLVGHTQKVHLAEERLAEDEDPHDVLRRMRVGEIAAHHLLFIEVVHLIIVSKAERLDRRCIGTGTGTAADGGQVVAVDVAPRAHILRGVPHSVGPKGARVRAREVRPEYGGVEVPDVLPALARVVPVARALEDIHEFLCCAPVERECPVAR